MASNQGVWGIDIGQCGVKALRCIRSEKPGRITAEAFDYIEYPKILSQPEADAVELVSDALEQFLSRNEVKGDRVAVSSPGQNGLARFIKLPPVEAKKIPDIVKYEARQQIPFDLEDVIWDYQRMAGGSEEEGFALETEVGLFAMKREQVARTLKPFDAAGIEVDIVQLTPLALYNFVAFDQLHDLASDDEYDPDSPPASTLVLSMGTDTTDLVITNGFRVWQRSVPIGGSHFTKALSKDLKQTFAKAEHLKRNAAQADNPKALFQAMRPVFADLVTEIQRSINFFSNIDRKAEIKDAVALGNATKLPGLVRFVSQNLKLPIRRVDKFQHLEGPGVIDAPAFQENVLAFPVSYGLCLQGLASPKIRTNLIPPEIVLERRIRAKKPWAVASAAALLLGLTFSVAGWSHNWYAVHDKVFSDAEVQATNLVRWAQDVKTQTDEAIGKFKATDEIGQHLIQDEDERLRWLRFFKALDVALPRDPPGKEPEEIAKQQKLYITAINTEKRDVATWWLQVNGKAPPNAQGQDNEGQFGQEAGGGVPPGTQGFGADPTAGDPSAAAGDPTATDENAEKGPTGEHWVVTLKGYHYHNLRDDLKQQGAPYVRNTLIKNLELDEILVPDPTDPDKPPRVFPVKKLGIAYPRITQQTQVQWDNPVPNPDFDPQVPIDADNPVPPTINQPVFHFELQFVWYDPAELKKAEEAQGDPNDPSYVASQ